MTTVFCSHRLGEFIGRSEAYLEPDYISKFGNWNGHLFIAERKRFLLFTNDRTAYSFVMPQLKKADLKDFEQRFREALIRQMDYDLTITERQETEIRSALADLRITKTNNNKRILGIMNEFIASLKEIFHHYGTTNFSALELGFGLNNYIIHTTLVSPKPKYIVPKELMLELLQRNAAS